MLTVLMDFVDTINESHAQGVCFGAKNRLYPAEIHTIVAIGQNRGINLTGLAEKLEISKPTLSERIGKLVEKEFVEKKMNPENRKAMTLWLTEEGKKAEYHHALHHEKMYTDFCNHFGTDAPQRIDLFTKTFKELNWFKKDVKEHG